MHIVFLARNFAALRNYERVITRLAERGHTLHLVSTKAQDALGGQGLVDRLARRFPGVTWGFAPDRTRDPSFAVRAHVRYAFDYLRYMQPEYADAPRLRSRARERTPRGMVRYTEGLIGRTRAGRRLAGWALEALESAFPADPHVDEWIREQRADLMLFTPLLALGSPELDFLTAARRQGVYTVFCVWSWDNLTSKALIRTVPDRVMVWNEQQKREAVTLHRVPPERVIVTGAQNFDHWFDRRPSRDRASFCARVGLPDASPYVLWVCSALFRGGEPEAPFVRRWIESLRASSDPVLRRIPVLVRPHPSRLKEWDSVSLDGLGPIARYGTNPIDADAQNDYFDSLNYSEVVVGLNTSAFLEAAIVGKPVHAILLPEFYEHQEGTLHFRYLMDLEGGLLTTSRTLPEHIEKLSASLQAPAGEAGRSRAFVRTFLRPHGLEHAATDIFVEALERGVAAGPEPEVRAFTATALARPAFNWLVRHQDDPAVHARLVSDREEVSMERRREKRLARKTKNAKGKAAARPGRLRALARRLAGRATPGAGRTRA